MNYQMAATAVTLKVIHQLRAFSNAILEHQCSILHDFTWQCACTVPLH